MTRPDQIAVVRARGQLFQTWTEIEVSRSTTDIIDHAVLTCTEPSPRATTLSGMKLQPGDQASISLAGVTVISGQVYMRQAVLNSTEHAVQIGVCSLAQAALASSVDGSPGQYVNQTLQQIGSATLGKVGVSFTVAGVAGADKPFERVSEHYGESRFAFVERLCRMRNLHLIDNGINGLLAFRGADSGSTLLREGVNIISGRILLKNDEHVSDIKVVGHNSNNDSADMNRAPVGRVTVDPPIARSYGLMAEEMGDSADMQMRAAHQGDYDRYQQVDGTITVAGWLAPDSLLWFQKVRQLVTVSSPSLLPDNSFTFMIKGVTHRQSSEGGTITEIFLCRADGFGSGQQEPLVKNQ